MPLSQNMALAAILFLTKACMSFEKRDFDSLIFDIIFLIAFLFLAWVTYA